MWAMRLHQTRRPGAERPLRRWRGAGLSLTLAALLGCPPASPTPEPEDEPEAPAPIVAGVARLTPEQVSKTFRAALGTDLGVQAEPNVLGPTDGFFAAVTRDFAIPLGGVDFLGRVRDRDAFTKVQTLLTSRGVAWPLAIQIVECSQAAPVVPCPQDVFLQPPGTLFTKCDIVEDFPSKDAAARARWQAQVQDFYIRLFSRSATPEELALVEETFERVYQREQSTSPAWLVTLYALLSSLETWHTWR